MSAELERSRGAPTEVTAFDLSRVPQLVTDSAGVIERANDAAAQLFGVRRPFLVGKPIAIYVAAADRRALRTAIAGLSDRATIELAFVLRPRHAADARVRASIVALAGADGALELHWVLHDVTTASQAALELRLLFDELEERVGERAEEVALERARFEALFHQMPGAVMVADAPSGQIALANDEARELFGEAIVGQEADGVSPLARALRSGEHVRGELIEMIRADGRRALLEATAAPVRGPHGAIVAAAVAFHDVSERERRERAEREFIENAAHQLRTPLTAITSAVEVLQSGGKDDPQVRDRFLAHIERASVRLSRLARSLLVLARAQTHEAAAEMHVVELEPLLHDAAAAIEPPDGVAVEVQCVRGAGVLADRGLVEETLAILAANAARYTRHGTITFAARADGDGRMVLEVSDTGPGIPSDLRERIFERFARGDDGSFGLGLAIAREAVAAMDGTLEVESEPGVGTTARVSLPAARLLQR